MSKGSYEDGVVFHAGFPNAAEDGALGSLSLDALVVRHRASTFFWRLETDVPELLWSAGSIVVVDRALHPSEGKCVVAVIHDEFLLCRVKDKRFARLDGTPLDAEGTVWGVVTYVVSKVGV